jgi:uncharacterized protein
MFARRPALPVPAPRPAQGPDWLGLITNPYVGASAAAGLMLVAAAGLVVFAGDPRAGAPSIRVPLDTANAKPLARSNSLVPPTVSLDTLAPGQEVALPGAPPGQALVTLPQGGSVAGGVATSQGGTLITVPQGEAAAPPHPLGPPLPPAPIAGLTAPGPGGLLPIIAKSGRTPFQAYARPFQSNGKPKIALVIGGLGLNAAATKAAIEQLPPEVTLSFVPYADGLQTWVNMARAAGHEVLLEVPMEPLDYPSNDPGPYTLMANAAPAETVKRLEWLLARTTGYFGVTNYLGGRFVSSTSAMALFAGALKSRGLAFIDDGSAVHRAGGLPRASASAVIDEQLSADEIDKQLLGLEAQALQHGAALGAGFSYPVTVEQVSRWSQGLAARGYQLAPASAITQR